ncbi:hypothetical protein D3C78_941740 [compost metagenome]
MGELPAGICGRIRKSGMALWDLHNQLTDAGVTWKPGSRHKDGYRATSILNRRRQEPLFDVFRRADYLDR